MIMKKCVYCLEIKEQSKFQSKAHVISQMMGDFSPELVFANEVICKKCNNEVLSRLECIFAEDSKEGIEIMMYGLVPKRTFRLRGERTKLTFHGSELGVFQNMFPKINPASGKVTPRPCVVLRNKNSALQVLLIDSVVLLTPNSAKYNEIKSWLGGLEKSDMHIFGNLQFSVERIVEILADFGIPYKEKMRQSAEIIPSEAKLQITIEGIIDNDIKRFICMMSFNYYCYCAQSSYREFLFEDNYNSIRNFVVKGDSVGGDWIIRQTNEPTLFTERKAEKRAPYYQVSFLHINGWIIGKVSLFGVFDYEVKIGHYDFHIDPANFGCGHNFDPFNKKWSPLYSSTTPIVCQNSFALFRR